MENALQSYLEKWHLSEPQLLAKTRSSHVYLVTSAHEKSVLKILNAVGKKEEQYGADILHYFNGNGAIRLLNHDADASLLEYVEGVSLMDVVEKGEDEKAAAIVGDVLNRLHQARPQAKPPEVAPLSERFLSLFAKAKQDRSQNSVYVRAADITKYLLSSQEKKCILHGDIHHNNIRQSTRGWLAYDPQGLFGERTYDAANTVLNPREMRDLTENEPRLLKTADILASVMNVNRTRLLAFVFSHACLSASWSLEDGEEPLHTLAIAGIVEPHIKHLKSH